MEIVEYVKVHTTVAFVHTDNLAGYMESWDIIQNFYKDWNINALLR